MDEIVNAEIVEEHVTDAVEGSNSLVHVELEGFFENGQRKVGVTLTALTREDALVLADVCRQVADSLEREAGEA